MINTCHMWYVSKPAPGKKKKKSGLVEFASAYHANYPTIAAFKVLVALKPAFKLPENLTIGY